MALNCFKLQVYNEYRNRTNFYSKDWQCYQVMANDNKDSDQQLVEPVFIHITKRLRQIAHATNKHSKYLHEKYKVTAPQIICLREILEHGPISFSKLTKIVALDNSTLTGIIDRLEKQGLVQRIRSVTDRRQILVSITETGITFLKDIPPPISENFIEGLKKYSDEEIKLIIWAVEQVALLLDTPMD